LQNLVVVRERGGSTLPAVFKSEAAALAWIKSRVLADPTSWLTKCRAGTTGMASPAVEGLPQHLRHQAIRLRLKQGQSLGDALRRPKGQLYARNC